jgi:hypothetical protein
MKLSILFIFLLLCSSVYGVATIADSSSSSAFERLKGLTGEWKGHYQWSGGRSGNGEIRAVYYITGKGSSVVENLTVGRSPVVTMTSVYHMDGDLLRMTHYCAAGNQPRLRANTISEGGAAVDFAIVDVSNLKRPGAGHVHKVGLEFIDSNRIRIRFVFIKDGVESTETVELERTS